MPDGGRKYLIDTDVLVHIRNRDDSERIYDALVAAAENGIVKTVRQVFGELQAHGAVHKRLAPHRAALVVPTEEQYSPDVQAVLDIVGDEAPLLYAQMGGKNPDPADPFLIAVGAAKGYTVVTNESAFSPFKIPAVCKSPRIGCRCINGAHFLIEIGIVTEIKPEHLSPAAFFRGS